MLVLVGLLRLGGAGFFVVSVSESIRPDPLDVGLSLAFAVLLMVVADAIAPRRPVN